MLHFSAKATIDRMYRPNAATFVVLIQLIGKCPSKPSETLLIFDPIVVSLRDML